MKASRLWISLFLLFAGGPFGLHAQTDTNANPSQPQGEHANGMLSFLTTDQQVEYAKARASALEHNPDLKSEGEELMKQGEDVLNNGTTADKQAFMDKMASHRQKLRQAMLKEDANLGPIFALIDQHLAQVQNSPNGGTSPPNPSAGR